MNEEFLSTVERIARRDGLLNVTAGGLCHEFGCTITTLRKRLGMPFGKVLKRLHKIGVPLYKEGDTPVTLRTYPAIRRDYLIEAALSLAKRNKTYWLTRETLAAYAHVAPATVTYHLGTVDKMRKLIMREAVKRKVAEVVALGLAGGDSIARRAPADVRQAALDSLSR